MLAQFAADVQYYLSQDPRQLPSRYLYDDVGSALFEVICRLPWYRVTQAEKRLLFEIEPGIRFAGQVGEQATMFLYDHSGNALEFKAFKDPSRLFAR